MDDEKAKREPGAYGPDDELVYPCQSDAGLVVTANGSAWPGYIVGGTFGGFGMRYTPEEMCESYVDDAMSSLDAAIEELPDGPAKAHLVAVLELLEEWTEMLK